jgi:uncharacterized phage protein (TIGR02218 family)
MKAAVAARETRVLCLRIVPVTGSPIRITDHARDLVIGAYTYASAAGYEFSGQGATADFSPAAIDLEAITAAGGLTRAAVASGLLDGARVYVFATSWANPVEDQEPVVAGLFGRTELLDDRARVGGLSLVDALGQTVGATYGAACPKTFGGTEFGGCYVNLASYTVTGTLTAVSSANVFRDSGRGDTTDTYTRGTLRFTSGANAGLKPIEVKAYAADGTITLWEPMYYLPAIGDAYQMTRGCAKTLAACSAYGNVLRFGGFPWVPTSSTYGKFGTGGG